MKNCVVDLSQGTSDEDVRGAVAGAFGFDGAQGLTWLDLEREFLKLGSGHTVVLVGLGSAERSCSAGVNRLLEMFRAVNAQSPQQSRFLLSPGDEYDASMRYLQAHAFHEECSLEAYVSCWIKETDSAKAECIASGDLSTEGWQVGKWLENGLVSPLSYNEDSESLGYYRQAALDGAVYVYDEWKS